MSHDPQHEIWNPFGEQVDSLSATERKSFVDSLEKLITSAEAKGEKK